MPLIVATLQSELIGILEKPNGNPAPVTVGMDIAKAYLNFCSAGMNVGGFPFTAMPGSTALGTELGNILGKTNSYVYCSKLLVNDVSWGEPLERKL